MALSENNKKRNLILQNINEIDRIIKKGHSDYINNKIKFGELRLEKEFIKYDYDKLNELNKYLINYNNKAELSYSKDWLKNSVHIRQKVNSLKSEIKKLESNIKDAIYIKKFNLATYLKNQIYKKKTII